MLTQGYNRTVAFHAENLRQSTACPRLLFFFHGLLSSMIVLCWLKKCKSSAVTKFSSYAFDPNLHWKLIGCEDFLQKDPHGLYSWIRYALRTEHRDVYMSLESSWMDNILDDDTNVNVRCMTHGNLQTTVMPTNFAFQSRGQKEQEIYEVVVTHIPPSIKFTPYMSGPIDGFLLNNPCWLVLKEPKYRTKAACNASSKEYSYENIAVFFKLPMYHYLPTCRIFTEIKNRNFPKICPDPKSLYHYKATSFGFGGETNKIVLTFHYALFLSKTTAYAADIADEDWYWINKTACPLTAHNGNIWMCNFIPFSKCKSGSGTKDAGQSWWEFSHFEAGRKRTSDADHKTLKNMGIDGHYLSKYGEGKSYGKMIKKLEGGSQRSLYDLAGFWLAARLYVYIHRPNLFSRHLIRRAKQHVRPVLAASASTRPRRSASTAGAGPVSILPELACSVAHMPQLRLLNGGHEDGEAHSSPTSGSAFSSYDDDHRLPPCLGLHVRNGDVNTDSRNERSTDRSFNAHIYASQNITKSLGIQYIFLATDNCSLFHVAPLEYPQYKWFAQYRPMGTGDSSDHVHTADGQHEIANLLTDALTISKCQALLGQGDGSITLLYLFYAYNNSPDGDCPLFKDLCTYENSGLLPYIGARHDASTYATFSFFPPPPENKLRK